METEEADDNDIVIKVIESMAVAWQGGRYKLNDLSRCLFLSIMEIHIAECDDIVQTFKDRYTISGSYRDDAQIKYHKHAVAYLRHIRQRIEGGYKRTEIVRLFTEIATAHCTEVKSDATIYIGASVADSDDSTCSGKIPIGDNTPSVGASAENKLQPVENKSGQSNKHIESGTQSSKHDNVNPKRNNRRKPIHKN